MLLEIQTQNFTNIRTTGAALIHAARHDEVNSVFRYLSERPLKLFNNMLVLSPAWNISAPNGQIFAKFDIRIFFENL